MSRIVEGAQIGFLRAHQWLYERTNGRVGHRLGPLRALLLRTTGRRTGQARVAALVYAPDGDGRYVVVASKGGSDTAPGWLHNLRADPRAEIQLGRRRASAQAHIVSPGDDDYARLWKIVNEKNRYKGGGRYEHYQTLTARPIPVVVLVENGSS